MVEVSKKVYAGDDILEEDVNTTGNNRNLRAEAQGTPDDTVLVKAGQVYFGPLRVEQVADENSPSFSAPSTNPKIDILVVDESGTLEIIEGTEAGSPVMPTIPADRIPICAVFLRVGATEIWDDDSATGANGTDHYIYQDLRPAFFNEPSADVFGDGSDGDVVISGNTSLTRDMYYNTLTINSGITLTTDGWRIFVKHRLTNEGTIEWNGNNGADGTDGVGFGSLGSVGVGGAGGAELPTEYLSSGSEGGDGGNGGGGGNGITDDGGGGQNGVDAENTIRAIGSDGGAGADGGAGGQGAVGNPGGASGDPGPANTKTAPGDGANTQIRALPDILTGRDMWLATASNKLRTSAGSGGGSGGGGGGNGGHTSARGGNGGGGGGAGGTGGIVMVVARVIVNNGTISSLGGDAGDGGDGSNGGDNGANDGGGGGGGGAGGRGAGGAVVLIYRQKLVAGTVSAAQGAIGTGGTKGLAGGPNGSDGVNGANSPASNDGVVYNIPV